jgi:SnoaL-like domain
MGDIDDLRADMTTLAAKLRHVEDQLELIQLVAQYGPNVDSGSAEATAALWTDDGTFDAVGVITMRGHDEIVGMVNGAGHQNLILNGCGHVLTTPHVVVEGDDAHGRSYALNIRWDPATERFWVARVSANTWRFRRTPDGWRITERINANLDGTPEHRAMLAP